MSTARLFFIAFALMMALSIFIGIITGLAYLNQQDLISVRTGIQNSLILLINIA